MSLNSEEERYYKKENAIYNFCINDIATEVNNKELIGLILVCGTQNESENPRSLGEKDIEWNIAAHKGPITEKKTRSDTATTKRSGSFPYAA